MTQQELHSGGFKFLSPMYQEQKYNKKESARNDHKPLPWF